MLEVVTQSNMDVRCTNSGDATCFVYSRTSHCRPIPKFWNWAAEAGIGLNSFESFSPKHSSDQICRERQWSDFGQGIPTTGLWKWDEPLTRGSKSRPPVRMTCASRLTCSTTLRMTKCGLRL